MPNHVNLDRVQALWNAARDGDYGPLYDALSDEVILENGPGAGPWHRAIGKDDVAGLLLEFSEVLDSTFHQDGRCVYAIEHVATTLVHETAKARSGDPFDNLAVYVSRLSPITGSNAFGPLTLTVKLEDFGREIRPHLPDFS